MDFFKLIRHFALLYIILLALWYLAKDYLLSILLAQLSVAALLSVVAWTLAYFVYDLLNSDKIKPENKAVLITGCDTGFGHALAKRLDALGFHVFAGVLFADGKGATKLQSECSDRMTVIQLDVTKLEQVQSAVQQIEQSNLPLWAVVNNAGIVFFALFDWGKDIEEYEKIFDVNVYGLLRVTKQCIPLLRKSGGRIVNVASLAGRIAPNGIGHYCMTKHSVRVFSDVVRREMYGSPVQVITLEPTFYNTPMMDGNAINQGRERIFSQSPNAIKQAYDETAIKDMLNTSFTLGTKVARNLNEVVDAMEKAVTLLHPKPFYRCCGYLDIGLWAVSHAPEVLIDFALHLYITNRFVRTLAGTAIRVMELFW